MKKFLAFTSLIAFAVTVHAGLVDTSLNGGTNNVAKAATNTVSIPISILPDSANVTLQFSFKPKNDATGVVTLRFAGSVDNGATGAWDTNKFVWAITPTASNTVTVATTNLSLGAAPFMLLQKIENPDGATPLTNVALKYFLKHGL